MHYMLYFPGSLVPEGKAGNAKAVLEANDMADIADGELHLRPVVANGPDGGGGVLVSWGKMQACKMEQQSWLKMPSGVYLGVWKDSSPTPQDLKRSAAPGQFVAMGDGQSYLVPHARMGPTKMRFNEAGELEQERTGKLGELFEQCEQTVWPVWIMGTGIADWSEAAKFVSRLLSVNYRLTYEIAVCRGLLDSENIVEACKVAVDMNSIMQFFASDEGQVELQKKSEDDDSPKP